MKIASKEPSRIKRIVIISSAVLLLGLGILAVLEKAGVTNLLQSPTSTPSAPSKQELEEQEKANDTKKQEFIEKAEKPVPSAPPQSSDSLTLTASQDDSTVTVLTKLKGFSGGACELKITNGTKSHTVNAEVIYQSEFSSCAGFSIPVSQLGAGLWAITLNATPTGGSELTTTTSLEVK